MSLVRLADRLGSFCKIPGPAFHAATRDRCTLHCKERTARRLAPPNYPRFARDFSEMTDAPRIDVPALIDARPIGTLQIAVAALCAAVMLLDGLNTQVIGYLGPALSKDWHLSRSRPCARILRRASPLMAGLLIVGPLSDKIGRKLTMILSTSCSAASPCSPPPRTASPIC